MYILSFLYIAVHKNRNKFTFCLLKRNLNVSLTVIQASLSLIFSASFSSQKEQTFPVPFSCYTLSIFPFPLVSFPHSDCHFLSSSSCWTSIDSSSVRDCSHSHAKRKLHLGHEHDKCSMASTPPIPLIHFTDTHFCFSFFLSPLSLSSFCCQYTH